MSTCDRWMGIRVGVGLAVVGGVLGGCATRRPAPPAGVKVAGPWGVVDIERARREPNVAAGDPAAGTILVMTGEGSRAAFGAGVLCGWSSTGRRPSFRVVTAVSSGALLATFAFLGPDYDERLRALTTDHMTRDIYRRLGLLSAIGRGGRHALGPLRSLLERDIDESILAAVAAEHAAGRRLFVATTNLDDRTAVLWDMGAIASSDRPDRLDRYHDVIIASMSAPVFLPPVYMEVRADGPDQRYWQAHVDGSIAAPVPLRAFMLRRLGGAAPDAALYVILNGTVGRDPAYAGPVRPRGTDLARASINLSQRVARSGALYRTYVLAARQDVSFHLAAISPDLDELPRRDTFNPGRLRKLFDYGYQAAADGTAWQRHPSALSPEELFEE